jgi:uncharacterized protein with HEPN domain
VEATTREKYDTDENLRLALAHLVQIFGEAARRISPELQRAYPKIPWKQIIGMRHKVVHDYLHVDFDIVWNVATFNIPPLTTPLKHILPPDTEDEDSP